MSTVFPLFIFLIPTLSYIFSDDTIRAFLRVLPVPSINKMMKITDTMARRSREIVAEKKAALAKGDDALAHEVGEGKDIMSTCRACQRVLARHGLWLTSRMNSSGKHGCLRQ